MYVLKLLALLFISIKVDLNKSSINKLSGLEVVDLAALLLHAGLQVVHLRLVHLAARFHHQHHVNQRNKVSSTKNFPTFFKQLDTPM